ncbi:hypothetical protein Moror_7607, partial [Moniliophthora roreri MCA 2997]
MLKESPTEERGSPSHKLIENSPELSCLTTFGEEQFTEEAKMSGEVSSTLKRELKTQKEMMISVATAVLEEVEKKKEKEKEKKGAKVAAPDPFEGDRKDTKQFMTK